MGEGVGWGGEGGHPDPDIMGEGTVLIFFSALRVSVWSKNKGGPRAPPLDPPLAMEFLSLRRRRLSLRNVPSCEERGWLFSQTNVGVGSSNRELERLFHCPKKWRSFSVGKHLKNFTNARNRGPVFLF